MEKLFRRIRLEKISGRTVLVESLVFLGLYLIWALLGPQAAAQRSYLGHLTVFVPFMTVSLEVVLLRKGMPPALRATWTLVALAFLFLALGRMSAFYTQLASFLGGPLPSRLDFIQAGAYPFFFFALLVFPFENRYAPSRFRFLMDATIMSGATIALALLVFPVRPDFTGRQVLSLLLPILDLVLLVLVLNVFLANKLNRETSALFGLAFFCFLVSDYLAYIAELTSGYQAGSPRDLGWIVGSLLLGLVAVSTGEGKPGRRPQPARPALGLRVQNILPVAMVLVLFWYVLTRWQYSGEISLFGLIMSLMLSLLLIVRMGIRAGEGELLVYWQLFSSIATPAFLCDRQGRIQLVNPAALRELGIEEEKKALGRRLEAFFPVEETLQGMLAKPGQTSILIDTQLVGSGVPFSLMLSPIYAENRRILVAVTAYNLTQQRRQQDILEDANQELIRVSERLEHLNTRLESIVEERTTHLRRALKQLEAQNRLLRDLDQMKSEFVSLVSHELRTPLTSLHGGMELLLSKHNLPKKTRGPLALMQGEVMRLTRFVVNILDVSSVEAGKLHINMQPVPVGVLVGRVIQELSVQPGAGRIQVLLDRPELRVMADETVLHSILLHLLDNALKYAPEGDVQLLVATSRRRARFQVIDRGPGIPEQKRHLLFRRFQRLDSSDSQAVYGYGLGLYFSRKMVAAMQGKLTYARLPDGGSCFQFGLEAVNETEDPADR